MGWNSAARTPVARQRKGRMSGSRSRKRVSGGETDYSQKRGGENAVSGGVDCDWLVPGDLLNFEPGENDEGLVGAVFAVTPAFGNVGIKELAEHPVRICRAVSHFEKACSLEFGETLQFATGKTSQEIENQMQIGRIGGANQCTHEGRAGGDDSQS